MLLSGRRWRGCHANPRAAAQFHQQAAGALGIPASQAGRQRIQQRRRGYLGEWLITPRCKTVTFALIGLALGYGLRAVGAGWSCHRSILVTVTQAAQGLNRGTPEPVHGHVGLAAGAATFRSPQVCRKGRIPAREGGTILHPLLGDYLAAHPCARGRHCVVHRR